MGRSHRFVPSLFLFFSPFHTIQQHTLLIWASFCVTVGLLLAYTAAMYILYTVAPILYRMASSAYYNLSLLSSDFYGLLFGLFLFVRIPIHLLLNIVSQYTYHYRIIHSLDSIKIALQRLLAILPRIRHCHPRLDHLLLDSHT